MYGHNHPVRYLKAGTAFLLVVAPLAMGVAAAQQPTAPQAPAPQPACAVSADADFGVTMGKPIRVGGGAMSVVARERAYMDALRGPDGQAIQYRRLGSGPKAPNGGIVDIYEVTYPGPEKPITLYIDAYRYDDPRAPKGFTCVPFRLGPPPIDQFMAADAQIRAALSLASGGDVPPISLDPDGSSIHGVALDRFRVIAAAARADAAAGTPMTPDTVPQPLKGSGAVLFAYPITCEGRTVPAASIDIQPAQGVAIRRLGGLVSGDDAAKLVKGFKPPAGAIASSFALTTLRAGDAVRISYTETVCEAKPTDVALLVRYAPAKALSLPQPTLPAGATEAGSVYLQVVIDAVGQIREPEYIGGPASLTGAAIAAIKEWKIQPATINGTGITADTLLIVQFRDGLVFFNGGPVNGWRVR